MLKSHWDIPRGFYVRRCTAVRIISIIWRICLWRQGIFRREQLFWTWAWAPIVFIRLSAFMNMAGDLPVVLVSDAARCPARSRLSFGSWRVKPRHSSASRQKIRRPHFARTIHKGEFYDATRFVTRLFTTPAAAARAGSEQQSVNLRRIKMMR